MSTTVAPKETIIQEIGEFFEDLLNPAAKLYNELDDAEKQAAVWGSTVFAAINKNLTAPPAQVETYIQQLLPNVDLTTIQGFIDEVIKVVDPSNTTAPLTLQEGIAWAQAYFQKQAGSFWGQLTKNAASVFTILASPETPIEKIAGVLDLVYHAIVRPNVVTLTPPTTPGITAPTTLAAA